MTKKPEHKTEAIKTLKMVHIKKYIHIKNKRKSSTLEVSLEVQELGLCTFTAMARVQFPVGELRV